MTQVASCPLWNFPNPLVESGENQVASREGPSPAQRDTQSRPAASEQHQGHLGTKSPPGCAQETSTSSTVRLPEFLSHHHAAPSDQPTQNRSPLPPLGNPLGTQLPPLPVLSPVACCAFSPSRILPYHPFLPHLPGQSRCHLIQSLPWGQPFLLP